MESGRSKWPKIVRAWGTWVKDKGYTEKVWLKNKKNERCSNVVGIFKKKDKVKKKG
jgi:hypothetical protein